MSAESMQILRVSIDVWLPDFKFGPGRCGVVLSRTPWYWETVTKKWIAEHMPDVPVNIMDQYHLDNFCESGSAKYDDKFAEIARRPTRQELRGAYQLARDLALNFEPLSLEKRGRWA